MNTSLTLIAWPCVWCVTRFIPIIFAASSLASFGVLASLMPPALPRPPASTWSLITLGALPARFIAAASCAVFVMTPPAGGTATPRALRISFPSCSRSFIYSPLMGSGRDGPGLGALQQRLQVRRLVLAGLCDLRGHHLVERRTRGGAQDALRDGQGHVREDVRERGGLRVLIVDQEVLRRSGGIEGHDLGLEAVEADALVLLGAEDHRLAVDELERLLVADFPRRD